MRAAAPMGPRRPGPLFNPPYYYGKGLLPSKRPDLRNQRRGYLPYLSPDRSHLLCPQQPALGIFLGRLPGERRCQHPKCHRFFPVFPRPPYQQPEGCHPGAPYGYLRSQREPVRGFSGNDWAPLLHPCALYEAFQRRRAYQYGWQLCTGCHCLYLRQLFLPDYGRRHCQLRRD